VALANVTSAPERHRVLLVDDDPTVRQELSVRINQEPDLIVCAEADGSASVLAALAHFQPDVLALEISLNGPVGLDMLKTLRSTDESLPILVLSTQDESIYAERALRAGANGYIMKREATANVVVALRRLLRREVYVSERISKRLLRQFVSDATQARKNPVASAIERKLDERVN
jgi:DNA-binding NarL/FixJ family response regulator